jgi:predicted protein tyrosine phosphatase
LLRSPTIAVTLAQQPWNYNTRAVGHDTRYALIPLDGVLVEWADEIVCADSDAVDGVKGLYEGCPGDKKIINLDIPDNYEYMQVELISEIIQKYENRPF